MANRRFSRLKASGISCWHLLGLAERRQRQLQGHTHDASILTERDVKEAYRGKARETHPDRFLDADDKKRAAIEFRGINIAKEEALEAIQNPTGWHTCDACFSKRPDTSQNNEQPASKHSETVMQHTTTVLIDELDREFQESCDRDIRVALELLHQAWPDKEKAWTIYQSTASFLSDLKSGLKADIYNYLKKRDRKEMDEYSKQNHALLHNFVRYAEEMWEINREGLLCELPSSWSDFDFIDASKMTTNPDLAKALQDHQDERMQKIYDEDTKKIEKAANDIASVYPDVPAIKRILDKLRYREHMERVLGYLPDDMRKLMGILLLESGAPISTEPK